MVASPSILVEIKDHVQIITLNRPEKKNAFNTEMITAWVNALEKKPKKETIFTSF